MPSPTEAALLDAVLSEPESDDVRLILADYLDDHGQEERSEFIRVQVELVSGDPRKIVCPVRSPQCPCRGCVLRRRERELFRREWAAPVQHWFLDYRGPRLTGLPPRVLFRRGFVAEVNCSLADWQAHGPALVRAHPISTVTTEREPLDLVIAGSTGGRWWNQARTDCLPPSAHHPESRYHLPPEIYAHLVGAERQWDGNASDYPTRAAALEALSGALLRGAKEG